ncbi:MAG: PAS domain-containing protein [Desulfobacteraceae bacterium]
MNQLESILSSLDTGLSVINSDHTISWVNQKIYEMFPGDNPIGQICHRFYESSDKPCEPCPTFQCFKSGCVQRLDKYNSAKERWYRIISQPMKDSDGQVISVLEGITDITDRKEKEKTIQQLSVIEDITERKRAEEMLHESEKKFRHLFDNSPIGKTITYVSGKMLSNHALAEMLGYSLDEFRNVNWQDITHPDDVALSQKIIESIISGEKEFIRFTKRYIHKNGSIIWGDVSTRLQRDNEGTPLYFITAIVDITERKRIENELRQSQKELQLTLNATADGIWSWNFKTSELFFSPKYYKMLGYQPNEFPANYKNWVNLIHPDDREGALAAANEFLKTKPDVYENEFRLKTKNGDYRWARTVAKVVEKDEHGNAVYMIGNHEDITEKKLALDAFIQERERFELAMRSVNDGLWDWNLKTNEIYYSPVWKKILGYEDHEIENKFSEWERLTHPEDVKKSWGILNEVFEGRRKSFENEFKMRHKNGHWVDILARADVIFDEDGKGTRVIGTHVDITERKKLEKQLQKSQKMEAIGSLAGGIAHDFNNILFPIVGLSEMMVEDLSQGSPEYLNACEILKAGRRGSELVKQILAFSRQSEKKPIPVQVQPVLKEALKLCRASIPADIDIHKNIQTNCGMVMADPTQLHQIVMNLITNAYHAIAPDHGTISVTLAEKDLETDDLMGSNLTAGKYVQLTVSDTGAGIDPGVIEKIFDPYFTTKAQGKGTGLGLSVVHGIIKGYGGEIKVYSEPGTGTTFTVYIPLKADAGAPESETLVKKYPRGNERILLVDDEKPIIKMEKTMLERLGYQVTSWTDSTEALNAFRSAPDGFDLVITDMSMPVITGDQLAEAVMSIRPDIPVIIISGFSERMNEETSEALGVKGYLKKPVLQSDMAHMIRKVLDDVAF